LGENHVKAYEKFADFLIWRWQIFHALSTFETLFFGPIQGESIHKSWIPLVPTKFKKFAFEIFVRRLEKCEQGSSGYTIERYPKLAPRHLASKK